ncbi:MAG: sel1 repeat family protein, partial [Burkholderiaceae bacterium]|nr:sel1 repeat family protein [Burkholderiaceae bacterium]
MRRPLLALLICAVVAAAHAGPVQVVPSADPDVAAGWAAYAAADHARAIEYYRKAAARNERVAQFNLAVMLFAGEGGPVDPV